MPGRGAHTLNISELEKAISSAVEHVKGQKAIGTAEFLRGPVIAGRYIRETAALNPEAESGLKQAADAITKEVNTQTPGLNAQSIVEKGPGHILMGFILNEE